jgi:hypothetical protein
MQFVEQFPITFSKAQKPQKAYQHLKFNLKSIKTHFQLEKKIRKIKTINSCQSPKSGMKNVNLCFWLEIHPFLECFFLRLPIVEEVN